ncbi:MAG: DUF3788 family protein [Bacteroidales bacterium]|jgi:hypothetical protein|nr:DUF3788 family protein [Bacteroidales bacterium]
MDKPSLNDPAVPPSPEVLQNVLGMGFPVYEKTMAVITANPYGLVPEWRYYNDGKAWLCKVVFKKKTIFWLSVWDGFFKTGFYFVERHCPGIHELEIDESIKQNLRLAKPSGTLYPVGLVLNREEQIPDLLKIIEYKKNLK